MHKADEEAQSLLRYQLKPALVLDPSGVVIAINPGGGRLLDLPATTRDHAPDSVIGKSISDLDIAIVPRRSPILRTWDDILAAASNGRRTQQLDGIREETSGSSVESDVVYETDEFWDLETEEACLVESDVYVVRTVPSVSRFRIATSRQESSSIKARANVRWYPSSLFLIVFERFSTSPSPETGSPPAAKHSRYPPDSWPIPSRRSSCTCLSPATSPSVEENLQDATPSAAQITSALIPYIMATLDPEGQVIQLSHSWYRFSGLSEAESLGGGWCSIMHPDDLVKMTVSWADVVQNKRSHWTHEARYRKASTGEYSWFLIRAQPYRYASGQIARWYASMMDINEWVVGRQEADRQRRSVLTLISQTDILLWGVDKSYQTHNREGGLKWNPPDFAQYLPSMASRETGQTEETPQRSSERGHHKLVSVVQAVLQGREFTPIVEHQEEERHFRTIFVAERRTSGAGPVKDGPTEVVLALTIETTDVIVHSKLLLELEKLAANERAASEASALKSRFLANMSHEIRTPISGIIGLSELLRDGNINKEQSDLAFDIHESAQFLLTLVNDILDLSKIDSGQMSIETISFNPCKMIRDTLVPLEFQARERELNLVWTYDVGTETTLLGDPHRMRQVLTNLISNSLKFTQKGTIRLDVTAVQKEGTDVLDMQFVVSDSGIGITKEALKQLFKPFSQADTSTARIYGGTGLGLSICQELIGLMGGRMTLDSTPGKGTTVTCNVPFNLHSGPSCDPPLQVQVPSRPRVDEASKSTTPPAAVQKPIQTKPPDAETKQASKSKLLILLVDDNAINRKVNSYLLEKFGHEVVTASNGQEALDYLCKVSGKTRPNLVFMDCMMPVVDGYEATRRIRNDADMFDEQTRTMPIVALTASGQESDKARCREAGMSDHISRPVSQSALKSAVLKWTSPKES